MRELIIDRYEGKFAVCEDKDLKYYAIELSELPKTAKTGDVLKIDDNGIITIDEEETKARKERIGNKHKRAFK